jgi:hypothetical protein
MFGLTFTTRHLVFPSDPVSLLDEDSLKPEILPYIISWIALA